MLFLREQLIDYHDRYTRQGEIPSYVYENFVKMYEAYHDLGRNGMVKKMYEEISGDSCSEDSRTGCARGNRSLVDQTASLVLACVTFPSATR